MVAVEPRRAFDPILGRDPTPQERLSINALRLGYSMLHAIVKALPANRERALALTHLEDSCMRAVRAILQGDA